MAESIKLFDSVFYDKVNGKIHSNEVVYYDGELYGTNKEGKIARYHIVNANYLNDRDKYLTDSEGKIVLKKGLYMISDACGYYINVDGKVETNEAYDNGKMYGVGLGSSQGNPAIYFNNVERSEYLNDENGAVKKQGIYYVNKDKDDKQVYISKEYHYNNRVVFHVPDKLLYYDDYFFRVNNRIIYDKHKNYKDTDLYKEKIVELRNIYKDKNSSEIDKLFLANYVKIEKDYEKTNIEVRKDYYDRMLNGIQYDHKYRNVNNGIYEKCGNKYLFKDGVVVRQRGIYKVSKIDDRGFFCTDGHKTPMDKYYYFDDDSKVVQNDFIFDGDNVYYADEDGELLRNHTLGEDLYFDSECKLVRGNVTKENVESIKKKLFYDSLYNLKYNAPITICSNEKELIHLNSIENYYSIDNNGNYKLDNNNNSEFIAYNNYYTEREKYKNISYLDEMTHVTLNNGEIVKNMFINFYGKYKDEESLTNNIYYFDENGHPVKNSLIQIGNEKYIFDKYGMLIVSEQIGKSIYNLIDKETANFDVEKYINKYIDAAGVLVEDKIVVEISWPYSDEGSPSYTYMTID